MNTTNLENKIFSRIKAFGNGCICTIIDFLDLSDSDNIILCLDNLYKQDKIIKIFENENIYRYLDSIGKKRSDKPFNYCIIAEALARQYNVTIIPTKDYALFCLGLIETIPNVLEFVTNGQEKSYKNDSLFIKLNKQESPELGRMNYKTELVLQALMFLTKQGVNESIFKTLKEKLSSIEKTRLLNETAEFPKIPSWIHIAIQKICKKEAM